MSIDFVKKIAQPVGRPKVVDDIVHFRHNLELRI